MQRTGVLEHFIAHGSESRGQNGTIMRVSINNSQINVVLIDAGADSANHEIRTLGARQENIQ